MAQIAVIGAGLMGHALALVHAIGGHQVRITDADPATLARAPGLMQAALDTLCEAGEVDASWTAARLHDCVRPRATLEETLADATFVVEAIVEEPAAKRALFAQIDR